MESYTEGYGNGRVKLLSDYINIFIVHSYHFGKLSIFLGLTTGTRNHQVLEYLWSFAVFPQLIWCNSHSRKVILSTRHAVLNTAKAFTGSAELLGELYF